MPEPKTPQDHKPKKSDESKTVTIDGHKFTVSLGAMSAPRTIDDLGLLQEAADLSEAGEDLPRELSVEITFRIPALMRRLLGYAGSRTVHTLLEAEHGDEYNIGHTIKFVMRLMGQIAPN